MVGQELLKVLAERKFPADKVVPIASERSAGSTLPYNGSQLQIQQLSEEAFDGIDIAFLATSADLSLIYAPIAAEKGALVIDLSSAWRMRENVPLVVPEVNPEDLRQHEGIVSNGNCCAIPLAVVLKALHEKAGLERVLVSTYQSASGAGRALVDELEDQTRAIAEGAEPQVNVYPHQLAYNVVPGGWKPESDGFNEEEVKIVNETRKMLHLPDLRIAATCVRVPVPIGHGESVFVETRDPISPDEFRALMASTPGVVVEDDGNARVYPTPKRVAGSDEVFVGRVRKDPTTARGLAMWLVSDNIRKGSAVNAVQVAEQAIQMGVLRKEAAQRRG